MKEPRMMGKYYFKLRFVHGDDKYMIKKVDPDSYTLKDLRGDFCDKGSGKKRKNASKDHSQSTGKKRQTEASTSAAPRQTRSSTALNISSSAPPRTRSCIATVSCSAPPNTITSAKGAGMIDIFGCFWICDTWVCFDIFCYDLLE